MSNEKCCAHQPDCPRVLSLPSGLEDCESFEARIRADERFVYLKELGERLAEEREACAKIAEQWRTYDGDGSRFCPPAVAAAIRARGGGKPCEHLSTRTELNFANGVQTDTCRDCGLVRESGVVLDDPPNNTRRKHENV